MTPQLKVCVYCTRVVAQLEMPHSLNALLTHCLTHSAAHSLTASLTQCLAHIPTAAAASVAEQIEDLEEKLLALRGQQKEPERDEAPTGGRWFKHDPQAIVEPTPEEEAAGDIFSANHKMVPLPPRLPPPLLGGLIALALLSVLSLQYVCMTLSELPTFPRFNPLD